MTNVKDHGIFKESFLTKLRRRVRKKRERNWRRSKEEERKLVMAETYDKILP